MGDNVFVIDGNFISSVEDITGASLEINYESEVYDVNVVTRDKHGNSHETYIDTYQNIDNALKMIGDIAGQAMGKFTESKYEEMLDRADPDTLIRIRAWIDAKLVKKV